MLMQATGTNEWRGCAEGVWNRQIDVRDFIFRSVSPYTGGPECLASPTERTLAVWKKMQPYFREEAKKGVLDVDVAIPSSLTSHGPGYIDPCATGDG